MRPTCTERFCSEASDRTLAFMRNSLYLSRVESGRQAPRSRFWLREPRLPPPRSMPTSAPASTSSSVRLRARASSQTMPPGFWCSPQWLRRDLELAESHRRLEGRRRRLSDFDHARRRCLRWKVRRSAASTPECANVNFCGATAARAAGALHPLRDDVCVHLPMGRIWMPLVVTFLFDPAK